MSETVIPLVSAAIMLAGVTMTFMYQPGHPRRRWGLGAFAFGAGLMAVNWLIRDIDSVRDFELELAFTVVVAVVIGVRYSGKTS
jgi:O-antigen ligase